MRIHDRLHPFVYIAMSVTYILGAAPESQTTSFSDIVIASGYIVLAILSTR